MNSIVFFRKLLLFILLFVILDWGISKVLLHGLNKYYGIDKPAAIVANGSSMTMSGLNRTEIEKKTRKPVAVFAREGVNADDRYAMLNYYFSIYPESAETVIYEVNPLIFSGIATASNVYTLFYPFMDNPAIDKYIKERADPADYYVHKFFRSKRFDVLLLNLAVKGYTGSYENYKTGIMDTIPLLAHKYQKESKDVQMREEKITVFKQTMDLISKNHANVILVMMPMHYLKCQVFNQSGLRKLHTFLEKYQVEHKNIRYINLNEVALTRDASYYADPLHLNKKGQKEITRILVESLVIE